MTMKQLLLFQNSPQEMQREIETLKEQYDKIRKGQHARISGLQKEIKDLRSEIEFLKSHICKTGLF